MSHLLQARNPEESRLIADTIPDMLDDEVSNDRAFTQLFMTQLYSGHCVQAIHVEHGLREVTYLCIHTLPRTCRLALL